MGRKNIEKNIGKKRWKMFENIKQFFQELVTPEKEEELNPLNYAFQEQEPSKRKMRKRINALETENEMLKESIKEELYKTFMAKLGEPLEMERLRNDNKNLRKKIKTLKEIIKEDNPSKKGSKER